MTTPVKSPKRKYVKPDCSSVPPQLQSLHALASVLETQEARSLCLSLAIYYTYCLYTGGPHRNAVVSTSFKCNYSSISVPFTNPRFQSKATEQKIDHMRACNCEIMFSKDHDLALEDSAMDVDQVDNLIKFYPTKRRWSCFRLTVS